MEFDEDEDIVKGFLLFDVIAKEIKLYYPSVLRVVQDAQFLGISHGWIFIGICKNEKLSIVLLNLFVANKSISLPPLAAEGSRGARVFISKQPSSSHLCPSLVVMYCTQVNDKFSSMMRFIRPMLETEKEWGSIVLDTTPTGIVNVGGKFFVSINGEVLQIDVQNRRLL